MKKQLITLLAALGILATFNGFGQSERAFQLALMIQTANLQQISIPPMADQIRSRELRADGSQQIDYQNGVRLILHADNSIEKLSPDRQTRQIFRFEGNTTTIEQYQRIHGIVYRITFGQDPEGGYVAQEIEEAPASALTTQ